VVIEVMLGEFPPLARSKAAICKGEKAVGRHKPVIAKAVPVRLASFKEQPDNDMMLDYKSVVGLEATEGIRRRLLEE